MHRNIIIGVVIGFMLVIVTIILIIILSKKQANDVIPMSTPTPQDSPPFTYIPNPQLPTVTPTKDLPVVNFRLIGNFNSPDPVADTKRDFPRSVNYNFLTNNGFVNYESMIATRINAISFTMNPWKYSAVLPLAGSQNQAYSVFAGQHVHGNFMASLSWQLPNVNELPIFYVIQIYELGDGKWNAYGSILNTDLILPIGFYQSNADIYFIGTGAPNSFNKMYVYKQNLSRKAFQIVPIDGYDFQSDDMVLWGGGSIASATGTFVVGTYETVNAKFQYYVYTFEYKNGNWKSNVFKQKIGNVDEVITNMKIDDFSEHLVVGLKNRVTFLGRLLLFQYSKGEWVETDQFIDTESKIISVDMVSSGKLVSLNTAKASNISRVRMSTGTLYDDTTVIPYGGPDLFSLSDFQVPRYIGPRLFESPDDDLIYHMTSNTTEQLSITGWDL
jgi:hypothetical protein